MAPQQSGDFVLTSVRLFDGNGGPPVRDAAVRVASGDIAWIGPAADVHRHAAGAHVVDLAGRALLPGFVDTHVHLTLPGGAGDPAAALRQPASLRVAHAVKRLRTTLHAGVTTVRDLMGADAGLRDAVRQRLVEGPRVLVAVTMLSQTAGHADFTLPTGIDLLRTAVTMPGAPAPLVDSVDAVRERVRALVAAGADCIKLAGSGGVTSPHDQPDWLGMRLDLMRAAVEEAQAYGDRAVAVHAIGRPGIEAAVRAGVTSIEHGYALDDELRAEMVERGQYLVPTLLETTGSPSLAAVSPETAAKAERWHRTAHESVAASVSAGVRVAMGTDAGIGPVHGTNLGELALLVRLAGMTPLQALTAGTRTGAELCGVADQVGTVEVGKAADLVATDADPLTGIDALADPARIHLVIKDGRLAVDRAGLVGRGVIEPLATTGAQGGT